MALSESGWWVYIIRSRSGKLYTGISTDPERRFLEHAGASGTVSGRGARFFRGDPPELIVYREAAADRSLASKREAAIKKLSRIQKLDLIEQALAAIEQKPSPAREASALCDSPFPSDNAAQNGRKNNE